eukprot:500810_1
MEIRKQSMRIKKKKRSKQMIVRLKLKRRRHKREAQETLSPAAAGGGHEVQSSLVVTYFMDPEENPEVESKEEEGVTVSVVADSLKYNASKKRYTVSLRNARVVKNDYYGNTVEGNVNKDKSDNADEEVVDADAGDD